MGDYGEKAYFYYVDYFNGFCSCRAGVGRIDMQEKTVATAAVVDTGCNLSVFVDGVVTSALNTAISNGKALDLGEEMSMDTGNCTVNGIVGVLDLAGVDDFALYFSPVEGEDYKELCLSYKRLGGTPVEKKLNLLYNPESGEVFGRDYDRGVMNIGFNYESKEKAFFATNDCWQRQFGFMPLYDIGASMIGYDYLTRRIFFDYAGKEWMVQVWKGNYHWEIFVGGEVGLYNRPAGTKNGWHYACAADEEMIPMTMKVYDNNETYVDRSSELTWWMTGFKAAGHGVSLKEVKLDSTFTFPTQEMCDAFTKAANECKGVTCTAEGKTASLSW